MAKSGKKKQKKKDAGAGTGTGTKKAAGSEGNGREPEFETVYAFPHGTRCTRCRSKNTIAYKTRGNKQYRRCRAIPCRRTYTVIGTEVLAKR